MKANLQKQNKTMNMEVTGLPIKAAQPRSLERALRGTGAGACVNHDFLFISCGLTLRHPRRLRLGLQTGFPGLVLFCPRAQDLVYQIKERPTRHLVGYLVPQLLLVSTPEQQRQSHFLIFRHRSICVALLACSEMFLA